MMRKNKVIAVVGPTASGKSCLAIELAKKFDGEIISADSRQIYKEFNIASAKPDETEKKGIVHHLIDVVDPNEEFTVANYADKAHAVILDIVQRGKVPIIAGGTGLYFRTLLQDFDLPRVEPDKALRAQLKELEQKEGALAIYKILEELDPDIGKKIHPNNSVKAIRAIEVCKALNIPMSQAQGRKEAPYEVNWFGLNAQNREYLYERINQRVEVMIEKGLIEEAKGLFEKYEKLPIMMATIGYQELYGHLYEGEDLQTTVEKIKQNTRRYAKRQLTWFRSNEEIIWFDIEKDNNISAQIPPECCRI